MLWQILLGVPALLLAALLLLPLRLQAEATSDPPNWRVRLALFGGLLPVTLAARDRKRRKREETPKAPEEKTPRRAGRRRPSGKMVRAGLRAGLEALGKVRIERLRGVLKVGLEDPALTGELYGRAGGLLAALPGRAFRLVPIFDREALEGEGELVLSLVPARLLPVAARFLWALR